MDRLTTVAEVRAWRQAAPGLVGFVPTMGALHEGHLALVREARRENDRVVVSIFVNPLQFGPNEDFERYPRDEEADCRLLEQEGATAVWMPGVAEMYPPGYATEVEVGAPLTEPLEGAARPGHFRGVTTVVAKLLLAPLADRAYFGMKDAQQLLVVSRMARDLTIPIEIVPVPTVRDTDGVALSSRNRYLSAEERRAAQAIPRGLDAAAAAYQEDMRDADQLRRRVHDVLATEPLLKPEYVSCADVETLEELRTVQAPALISLAVRVGSARLIDNCWLGLDAGGLRARLNAAAAPQAEPA